MSFLGPNVSKGGRWVVGNGRCMKLREVLMPVADMMGAHMLVGMMHGDLPVRDCLL